MAGRYDGTKAEIDGNVERVRSLVSEGNNDGARELTAATELLIDSLPKNQQKSYREALESAGTPPNLLTPIPLTHTWRDLDGVQDLVSSAADAMAEGVRFHMKGAAHARVLAQRALDVRLRIPNRNLPDVLCWSQDARDAQSEMYALAGKQVEGTDEERQVAVEALMLSVRGQMLNVLPEFLRSLDNDPDKARKHFGKALEQFPDEKPTEAVYRAYEAAEMPLSRHTDLERRAMRKQLKNAKADHAPETVIQELESKLGIQKDSDPETTLSTDVSKLRKSLAAPVRHIDVLPTASPEVKADVREAAKEVRSLAEKLIEATEQ